MSKVEADAKVDAARAKIQAWGAEIARGHWDWHHLGHALQLAHEGVELSPTYQRPWTLLADIYHRIGMPELARRCLTRSYKLATPGPRHPGRFYREVEDHLRTGYPFDGPGRLNRAEPPEFFDRKYRRYWSIDDVMLASSSVVAPSSIATAFLSYAREDLSRAEKLRADLIENKVAVWMDTHDLVLGDTWEQVIRETLASRDFVICGLSRASVTRVGFFQVEMKEALRAQERRPSGVAFLLPIRFEDCEVPARLKDFHYVDLFPNWADGVKKTVSAVRKHAGAPC